MKTKGFKRWKLLVWLVAENSYWNNVALWLAAEREHAESAFWGSEPLISS